MSEADLIEAVRNSDSDAFAVVFRRYYPVIQRFVYALLKDERFSEDIAQDVFAKLWLYRERLEPESSLKNYLYVMARNAAFDTLKAKKKTITSIIAQLPDIPDDTHSPDKETAFLEINANLLRSISGMPRQRQIIFKMSRFEYKSEKEIAELLNLSVRTVEKHIQLALKQLKGTFS